MAVEESIKIKIQANAEEFKIVSNIINTELGKLGKNFQILEGNIKQTSNAMKGFDGSSKKFNKGIMSISLILQDLPYGFRGIQNNIPALAQGFGVLYLAISAVTAAMTYFVLEGDKMSKGTKQIYESFKDFINGVVSDLYNALAPAFESIVKSIKFLWSLFGDNIISIFKDTWDTIINVIKIAGQVLADGFTLITSLLKGDWQTFGETLINIWKRTWNAIVEVLSFGLKTVGNLVGGVVNIFDKDLGKTIQNSTKVTANKFSNNFKYAFKEVEKAAKKIDVFSLFGGKKKTKEETTKEEKPTVSKVYEDLAQEEFNFYKDSIFRAEEYFVKLNNIQKNNALMEATIRGASVDELFAIQQTYAQKEINFRKSIEDKKFAIRQQSEEMQKQLTKSYEDKKLKDQYDYTTNYIKTLDLQLKAELRLHRNNVAFQQEDTKNKIKQLEIAKIFAHGNVKALDAINAAILRLQGALTGLGDLSTSIDEILRNTLQSTFEGIGESLGELVTTGKFNLGTLGSILADALISIGKALILYSSLVQAAKKAIESGNVKGGLILGIAAVAAGFALKGQINKKRNTGPQEFANGGIVSGPTLGLMGEYPGASRNPEVVAPLDKLKSLMGEGGGTLEARISGNDLLILMNKAGRTNNNTF
jgi:hypothetical protein